MKLSMVHARIAWLAVLAMVLLPLLAACGGADSTATPDPSDRGARARRGGHRYRRHNRTAPAARPTPRAFPPPPTGGMPRNRTPSLPLPCRRPSRRW